MTGREAFSLARPIHRLLESESIAAPLKVDRDRGIIYGVKVCGLESPNSHGVGGATSTQYTPEALQQSADLYENADVYLNHRDKTKPVGDRPVREKLGKIRNVRMTESGLRGDLYYNRAHPFADEVLDDVERGLGMYSLSHDAKGHGEVRNGVFVVDQILVVRSVDLVDRGATTANLWESKEPNRMATMTLRELLTRRMLATRSKPARKVVSDLLEADYMMPAEEKTNLMEEDPPADMETPPPGDIPPPEPTLGDMPVDVADGGDPNEALTSGMTQAAVLVIQDTGIDLAEKLKRIKDILTAHDKLVNGKATEAAAPVAESDHEEPDGDEGEAEGEMKESLEAGKTRKNKGSLTTDERAELLRLRAERQIADLCEAKQFNPTPIQRKALVHLQESDRVAFIEDAKRLAISPAKQVTARRQSTAYDPADDFSRLSDEQIKQRLLTN